MIIELLEEVFTKDALIFLQSESFFLEVGEAMAALEIVLEVPALKTS